MVEAVAASKPGQFPGDLWISRGWGLGGPFQGGGSQWSATLFVEQSWQPLYGVSTSGSWSPATCCGHQSLERSLGKLYWGRSSVYLHISDRLISTWLLRSLNAAVSLISLQVHSTPSRKGHKAEEGEELYLPKCTPLCLPSYSLLL